MGEKEISRSTGFGKVIERQVRNWEIAQSQKLTAESAKCEEVCDFITIGNICGSGGIQTAVLLSEELNWPVFDRQILTAMAGDDELRTRLYRSMDERDLGWLENTFRSFMQVEFRKNDYFHRLTETLLCLARQSHAIFIGRSADLILPKNKGLRVKMVASLEHCAQNFAEHNHCSLEQARSEIARIESILQ